MNVVMRWGLRILAVALVLAAAWWHGWTQGVKHETAVLDAFKAQVAQEAAQAAQRVAQEAQAQATLQAQKEKDYATQLANLDNYYRMRIERLRVGSLAGSGSAVPAIPTAPGSPNATAADALPALPSGPQTLDQVPDQALPLAAECAATTEQLEELQQWITASMRLSAQSSQ